MQLMPHVADYVRIAVQIDLCIRISAPGSEHGGTASLSSDLTD